MQIQRFDFGSLQDFRIPPKAMESFADLTLVVPETPAAPPPPPTFSEQELMAAKQHAFEEGRLAGVQEGVIQAKHQHAERDAHLERTASAIVQQAIDIETRHRALMEAQCMELNSLVMMISRKVAGDAISSQPTQAVETLIRDCLAILVRQPTITLSVHASLVDEMKTRLQAAITKLRSNCAIVVEADNEMQPGEGKLEWKDGYAERNLSSLWEQISEKLQSVDFTAIAKAANAAALEASVMSNTETLSTDQPETNNNSETLSEGEAL